MANFTLTPYVTAPVSVPYGVTYPTPTMAQPRTVPVAMVGAGVEPGTTGMLVGSVVAIVVLIFLVLLLIGWWLWRKNGSQPISLPGVSVRPSTPELEPES